MDSVYVRYHIDETLTDDVKLTLLERQKQILLRKLNHVFGNPLKEKELSQELDDVEGEMYKLQSAGGKTLSLDDIKLNLRDLSQQTISFEEEPMGQEERVQIEELEKIRELQAEVLADAGATAEISLNGIYKIVAFYQERGSQMLSAIWLSYGAKWYPHEKLFANMLYYLYRLGIDGLDDPNQQFFWRKKAADNGNRDACYEMGQYYMKKDSAQYDLAKAGRYFAKAADRKHPEAYLHAFATFYSLGDYKRAEICLTAADKLGIEGAAYRLGLIYDVDENPEGARNPEKALFWHEKAYKQKPDGDICYALGNLYDDLGRQQEAAKMLEQGVKEFDSEDCKEALEELKQTMAKKPEPSPEAEKPEPIVNKAPEPKVDIRKLEESFRKNYVQSDRKAENVEKPKKEEKSPKAESKPKAEKKHKKKEKSSKKKTEYRTESSGWETFSSKKNTPAPEYSPAFRSAVQECLDREIIMRGIKAIKPHEPKAGANASQKGLLISAVFYAVIAYFIGKLTLYLFGRDWGLLGLITGAIDIGLIVMIANGILVMIDKSKVDKKNAAMAQKVKDTEKQVQTAREKMEKERQNQTGIGKIFLDTPYKIPKRFDDLYHGVDGYVNIGTVTYPEVNGDVFMAFYDSNGRPARKRDYDNIAPYLGGARGETNITKKDVEKLLASSEFITLYQDKEFLKENKEETYKLSYLMDRSLKAYFADNRGLYKPDSFSSFELDKYAENHFKAGTAVFMEKVGEYFYSSYVLNHTTVNPEKSKIVSWNQARKNNVEARGEKVVSSGTLEVRKKALIVWHEKRIVAIFLQKDDPYTYCTFHFWLDQPADGDVLDMPEKMQEVLWENTYGKRVDALSIQNTDRELTIASAMDYIVRKLSCNMMAPDILEEKPEGISDENWRYWITLRYEYRKHCIGEQ